MAFTADGRRVVAGGSYGTVNVWDAATGRLLVTLFAFPRDEGGTAGEDWLAYGPEGAYDGPAGVERYLAWRKGDDLLTPAPGGEDLRRPGRIAADLRPAD
jgi:hypothetical protein